MTDENLAEEIRKRVSELIDLDKEIKQKIKELKEDMRKESVYYIV